MGMGNTVGAYDLYLRALRIIRESYGSDSKHAAVLLNNLAALRFKEGLLEESAQFLEESIGLLSRLVGDDHPDVGHALLNLVAVRLEQRRFEEAEMVVQQASEIFEATYGDGHPAFINLCHYQAEIFAKTGRGGQARAMRRQARDIRKRSQEENLLDHTIDVSAFTSKAPGPR
jgi:tetratricopeptide (TPR) repeat protein